MTPARSLVAALLFSIPGAGWADGSCGQGGAPGSFQEDWDPSEYYLYVPNGYDPARPMPLLVTLHGDEGDPASGILWAWEPYWSGRMDFIWLAPRAPYAGGSWYQAIEEHDEWLTSLVDDILARYNVDLARIYITGWSGGASFLGTYALIHQERFAAVTYSIGGYFGGYDDIPAGCPGIPARFVDGTTDFLRDMALDLADSLRNAGHEVDWVDFEGGHDVNDAMIGPSYEWMEARVLCSDSSSDCGGDGDADADADVDTDADTDADVDTDADTDADVDADVDGDVDGDADGDGDGGVTVDDGRGGGYVGATGCSCKAPGAFGGRRRGSVALALILLSHPVLARRRRRPRRPPSVKGSRH